MGGTPKQSMCHRGLVRQMTGCFRGAPCAWWSSARDGERIGWHSLSQTATECPDASFCGLGRRRTGEFATRSEAVVASRLSERGPRMPSEC